MRLAFIADIHGNLPALEAVLEDARDRRAEHIICLGDIVGYGPQPVECLHRVREATSAVVLGNHDAAACGRMSRATFNAFARATSERAALALSEADKAWLQRLPYTVQGEQFACTHGSFDRPESFPYVDSKESAERALAAAPAVPLSVVAHTHIACVYLRESEEAELRKYPPTDFVLKPGARCLINPGSVGFPRGEQVAATYALYDTITRRVAFRVIRYDLARYRLALVQNSYDVRDYWFLNSTYRRSVPEDAFLNPTPEAAGAPLAGEGFAPKAERSGVPVGVWLLLALLMGLIGGLSVSLFVVKRSVEDRVEAVEVRAAAALAAVDGTAGDSEAEPAADGDGRAEDDSSSSFSSSSSSSTPASASERFGHAVRTGDNLMPPLARWVLPEPKSFRMTFANGGHDLIFEPPTDGGRPPEKPVSFRSPVLPLPEEADRLMVRFTVEVENTEGLHYTCCVQYMRADGSVRSDRPHLYKSEGRRAYRSEIPAGSTAFRLRFSLTPSTRFRLGDPQVYPAWPEDP